MKKPVHFFRAPAKKSLFQRNGHALECPFAGTFRNQIRFIFQSDVDDAAVMGVHGRQSLGFAPTTHFLGGMVPFIVIMGVFIFLMWNGQRKERKKKEEMLSSIKVGEEIVTIGGIMGTVDTVKEDHFVVKISDNARIKVLKNAVSQIVRPEAANAEPEKK